MRRDCGVLRRVRLGCWMVRADAGVLGGGAVKVVMVVVVNWVGGCVVLVVMVRWCIEVVVIEECSDAGNGYGERM